jgi:hypothetical protein
MGKLNRIATLLGLLSSSLIIQVQAANCQGSHNSAWGENTWHDINAVIATVCNDNPYKLDYTSVQTRSGYNVAEGRAQLSGGSPNCWKAMYQIRDQCLDTGNGAYATQGSWSYEGEYYFLWAWSEADCLNYGHLHGYQNPGC